MVVPLVPRRGLGHRARLVPRASPRRMAAEQPDRYVVQVPKAKRRGRILIDWLRNGLGATAVASFSPRARPGAGVATPLAWREVTQKLDPAAFTLLQRARPAGAAPQTRGKGLPKRRGRCLVSKNSLPAATRVRQNIAPLVG